MGEDPSDAGTLVSRLSVVVRAAELGKIVDRLEQLSQLISRRPNEDQGPIGEAKAPDAGARCPGDTDSPALSRRACEGGSHQTTDEEKPPDTRR